jgi:hypothetical protein
MHISQNPARAIEDPVATGSSVAPSRLDRRVVGSPAACAPSFTVPPLRGWETDFADTRGTDRRKQEGRGTISGVRGPSNPTYLAATIEGPGRGDSIRIRLDKFPAISDRYHAERASRQPRAASSNRFTRGRPRTEIFASIERVPVFRLKRGPLSDESSASRSWAWFPSG